MRPLLLTIAAAALAGCASAPVADAPRQLFADSLFANTARPPVNEDIFAMNSAMREFARTRIARNMNPKGHSSLLSEALKREIKLEYDTASTRKASDTFDAHAGNCLSLVILTGAFAKYFEIPFDFQAVHGFDSWSRAQGIAFLNGHVNIKMRSGSEGITIDFMEQGGTLSTRRISEERVRAMYLNNRAAEALVAGDVGAYWWARAAIEADPGYVAPANTLAVVYLRAGALREAERALQYVLERETDNAVALTNLVRVYARLGREADAGVVRVRLADVEPYPPFYFLDQGLAALERGDLEAARELLNRELRRMPFHDEVHFALALADLREGEQRSAKKHLGLAMKYSITRERRDIYSAKLTRLQGVLN